MGNKDYDPVTDVRENFHRLQTLLQQEIKFSSYSTSIPVGYFDIAAEGNSYGIPDQRSGRFLQRNNPALLQQFVLANLEALKSRGDIPATQARTFFFRTYGVRNSATLKLINMPTMSAALQSKQRQTRGRGKEKGEGLTPQDKDNVHDAGNPKQKETRNEENPRDEGRRKQKQKRKEREGMDGSSDANPYEEYIIANPVDTTNLKKTQLIRDTLTAPKKMDGQMYEHMNG